MASLFPGWESLALRIVLGAIFIVHGLPKLKNLKGTADMVTSIGFRPGMFWAFMLAASEFFGGILLVVGLASRVAAAFLVIAMLVATGAKIFVWKIPFTKGQEAGWEYDAMLLAGLVAVLLLGSGNISVDQMMGWMLG